MIRIFNEHALSQEIPRLANIQSDFVALSRELAQLHPPGFEQKHPVGRVPLGKHHWPFL